MTLKIPAANEFCDALHYGYIKIAAPVRQKGVRQKEFGKKRDEKSDRSIRKSDQKVTERVPKTKKVIELLLPTTFGGTLIVF